MAVQAVRRGSQLIITLSVTDKNGDPVTSGNASAYVSIVNTQASSTLLARTAMAWDSGAGAWTYTADATLFQPYQSLEVVAETFDVTGSTGTLLDTETQPLLVGS